MNNFSYDNYQSAITYVHSISSEILLVYFFSRERNLEVWRRKEQYYSAPPCSI